MPDCATRASDELKLALTCHVCQFFSTGRPLTNFGGPTVLLFYHFTAEMYDFAFKTRLEAYLYVNFKLYG